LLFRQEKHHINVFKEKRHFFSKNWPKKSQKIVIITLTQEKNKGRKKSRKRIENDDVDFFAEFSRDFLRKF
jgi:hypothetical protein